MKHVILSVFSVLFFVFALSAQNPGKVYYNYINQAELNIAEGNYSAALEHYKEAFAETKINFGIDLYNALVCSVYQKNTKQVLLYTNKLADKGVGAQFFEKKIFKKYLLDKNFQEVLTKADTVKKNKLNFNKKYLNDLCEFRKFDSVYNKLRHTKYSDSWKIPDTLEVLFRENARSLLSYVQKNGFYSENKLGVNIVSDTIFGAIRKPDVVFLHYLEMGKDKKLQNDIKDVYVNAINNGEIAPNFLAGIIELANGVFGETGSYIFKIYDCKIYKLREVRGLEEINAVRQVYLLGSLEDFEKKFLYKYCVTSDFDFHYHWIRSPVSKESYFYTASDVIGAVKDCGAK